jgi:hypothetical protein
MRTKIKRMLGALFVAGLVFAAPALAYNTYSWGGGRAEMKPGSNTYIRACDTRVDGHRVRVWYYTTTQNPSEPTFTPFAPSGGCTAYVPGSWGSPIAAFQVCVEAVGCSGYVPRG